MWKINPIVSREILSKAKAMAETAGKRLRTVWDCGFFSGAAIKTVRIDVKSPMDPIHWFLDRKEDVRSSYYLEDVPLNFKYKASNLIGRASRGMPTSDIQRTVGNTGPLSAIHWNRIRKQERQTFLKNAYRVLLTRARQGMVIVVPPGSSEDLTRKKWVL